MAKRSSSNKKRPIEQYDHKDKDRLNNPPVGMVTPDSDADTPKQQYAYDPHLDPQLQWTGKTERTSFEVDTVSLHVHERIDPKTIILAVKKKNGSNLQASLFDNERQEPLREAIDFYKHRHNWSNRLVAGDSLLVMNSLLTKEGMAGKVQMVYIDPPYGIKYGSNFQPFVNKRDVKDRNDEDLTQEPEMIKAFRDTWELGIHSYLSYLRDRLLLARELLTESGSVFVQISDENVHHVREIMDEVFGVENFVSGIVFRKKTMPLGSTTVERMHDFLLWYSKSKASLKVRQLYQELQTGGDSHWSKIEIDPFHRRRLSSDERNRRIALPEGGTLFQLISMYPPSFSKNSVFPVEVDGKTFTPRPGACWITNNEGMQRLSFANRVMQEGAVLRYVLKESDYPWTKYTSLWSDTVGVQGKRYVVETNETVIQRCMLMCTDPGDLVFDPTCGSGTTAYVAEEWGRRWITCDTSRVAVALAKQRLMTATYDYYALAYPQEGVGSGFKYKTVPHITLKSIANNEEIDTIYDAWQKTLEPLREFINKQLGTKWEEWEMPREPEKDWDKETKSALSDWWDARIARQKEIDGSIARRADSETLYDQPEVDKARARVTGPFTVEAVPAPMVQSLDVLAGEQPKMEADASAVRTGETRRLNDWADELLRSGVRGKGGQRISFSRVELIPGYKYLHAVAETKPDDSGKGTVKEGGTAYMPQTAYLSYGPDYAPLEQRQVELAIEEVRLVHPKPNMLIFAAFQFDPEAAKDIDETPERQVGMTLLKAQMNTDMLTDDLKKKRSSNESYWLMGQPDIIVKKGKKEGAQYTVEVLGFDYYNTKIGELESGGKDRIAMWMLDPDYDGRSLYPKQVFFPMAGKKEGWSKLAKSLQAEIDEDLIDSYGGTVSLPFEPGPNKRLAVKIIDDRGIESFVIRDLD